MPDTEEQEKTVDIDTSGPDAEISIEEKKEEAVIEQPEENTEKETGTQETITEEPKKSDEELEDYSKGVQAYRAANPGSKLKTAVTGKVKKGSKAANRRKSYCARSAGQLRNSSAKTRNDPNSRIRQARRRWKC